MGRVHLLTDYLADTHILLWVADDPGKVDAETVDILRSDAVVYVSIASIWEIAIKAGLGKLDVPASIADLALSRGFTLLPIATAHAEAVRHLPHHHRDPFDRMLIAQAQVERLTLLTADPSFAAYDIRTA